MINNNLAQFGYIGNAGDLIFDIFTGGLLSEQDERTTALGTRLDEWNQFLNGDIFKLPEHLGCLNTPIIDEYLSREFAKYVDSWIEGGAPAATARFTRAHAGINGYFRAGAFNTDVDYYADKGTYPAIGRQKFIFDCALSHLPTFKKRCNHLGFYAAKIDLYAMDRAKSMRRSNGISRGNPGIDV